MAKGIINILADNIFPASAPANQTENKSLKTLLFSQPLTKGDADDAISHITEKFTARQTAAASQNAAVEKPDDEKTEKTVNDFFKEICERQPFDYNKLCQAPKP